MPTVAIPYHETYATGTAGETLAVTWFRQPGAATVAFADNGGGDYTATYTLGSAGDGADQYLGKLVGAVAGDLGALTLPVAPPGLVVGPVAGVPYREVYLAAPGETLSVAWHAGSGTVTATFAETSAGSGSFVGTYTFPAADSYGATLTGSVSGELGPLNFDVRLPAYVPAPLAASPASLVVWTPADATESVAWALTG